MSSPNLWTELALPALLAPLWGQSYLFTKVAVAKIPPVPRIEGQEG